jgi:hypothetical protein
MIYKDDATGLSIPVADDHTNIDLVSVLPLTKKVYMKVSELGLYHCGKEWLATSGHRTVEAQRQAMENLQKTYGDAYYIKVYGNMIRNKIPIESMPHVSGRAIDARYRGFEAAQKAMQELNTVYLESAPDTLGFTPSRLVVIESGNCYHVQIPAGIKSETEYLSFIDECILNVGDL